MVKSRACGMKCEESLTLFAPRGVVVENSPEWRSWVPSVRRDLWRIGYPSVSIRMCPSQFGAPHRRPRVFVVADSNSESKSLSALHAKVASLRPTTSKVWERLNETCRALSLANGLPQWMARAFGNSVSPVVTEWIGAHLVECFETTKRPA